MPPTTENTTATAPQFPEILPVIEQYLENCKKTGKPMRVNLWDASHFTNEPLQVLSDPALRDLAKKYGSSLYVAEVSSGEKMTKLVKDYVAGDAEATKKIEAMR